MRVSTPARLRDSVLSPHIDVHPTVLERLLCSLIPILIGRVYLLFALGGRLVFHHVGRGGGGEESGEECVGIGWHVVVEVVVM